MNIYSKIFENNKNLLERMDSEDVESKYLKKEDVFLVTLKQIDETDSIDSPDGLVTIHYNPTSYEIVGFTIPYVREFIEKNELLARDQGEKVKEIKDEKFITPTRVATSGLYTLSYAF